MNVSEADYGDGEDEGGMSRGAKEKWGKQKNQRVRNEWRWWERKTWGYIIVLTWETVKLGEPGKRAVAHTGRVGAVGVKGWSQAIINWEVWRNSTGGKVSQPVSRSETVGIWQSRLGVKEQDHQICGNKYPVIFSNLYGSISTVKKNKKQDEGTTGALVEQLKEPLTSSTRSHKHWLEGRLGH